MKFDIKAVVVQNPAKTVGPHRVVPLTLGAGLVPSPQYYRETVNSTGGEYELPKVKSNYLQTFYLLKNNKNRSCQLLDFNRISFGFDLQIMFETAVNEMQRENLIFENL